MEFGVKLYGLSEALDAVRAAFPVDQNIRAQIVNGSIGAAARKTMLPMAKQLADEADASGALSESLAVRAMGKRKRGPRPFGMEMVPVRDTPKAIRKYLVYYGDDGVVYSGIRHGHLIEFGFSHTSGKEFTARPFLWPAGEANAEAYKNEVAKQMKKRTEARVRNEAKKGRGDKYFRRGKFEGVPLK